MQTSELQSKCVTTGLLHGSHFHKYDENPLVRIHVCLFLFFSGACSGSVLETTGRPRLQVGQTKL